MIEVIKEGRAALVTSFGCFKFMALYSIIQFTTITLLYSFASSLADLQFLYIDLFIIIPIAIAMGRTQPFDRIHPKRPTASLVSKKVLASIIGQIVITSSVQVWTFVWTRAQPWYEPPKPDLENNKLETTNYENTTLFLVSCFQYVLVAAVFSIGPPYRKPIWTNGWLMFSIISLSLLSTVLLLAPPKSMEVLVDLMPLPIVAKLTLLAAVVVNVLISVAYERWGCTRVARLSSVVLRSLRPGNRRTREGKVYKAVEQ